MKKMSTKKVNFVFVGIKFFFVEHFFVVVLRSMARNKYRFFFSFSKPEFSALKILF